MSQDVTVLLEKWKGGDREALNALMPLVYDQLRSMAQRYMSSENSGHTLRTTALVHEAYIKLLGGEGNFENRSHFFAVAARAMRTRRASCIATCGRPTCSCLTRTSSRWPISAPRGSSRLRRTGRG